MEQHLEEQQYQSEPGASGSRLPRLRSSCDSCTRSKLRCDQGKPSCRRCSDRNDACVYSRIGRVGRPPRLSAESAARATTSGSTSSLTAHQGTTRTHKANRRVSVRESSSTGQRLIPEVDMGQRDLPSGKDQAPFEDHRPSAAIAIPVDPQLGENEEEGPSVRATTFSDPWLLASGCDEEVLTPSQLQQLLTPTSEATISTTDGIAKLDSTSGAYLSSAGHDLDLDFDYFGSSVRTATSGPLETVRFPGHGLETVSADLDSAMDVDIDADFILSPKSLGSQPQFLSLPLKPSGSESEPAPKAFGQFETVWNQVTSTTSDLQEVIGTIAPAYNASPPTLKRCACPTLIGRLQLLAVHPRLAPQRCTGGYHGDRHRSPRALPLDLLIFLDDIVYRTITAVTDCAVCGSTPRALFTLCLHVDWLVDVLKETLESGLPGLESSTSGFDFNSFRPSDSFPAHQDKEARGISTSRYGAESETRGRSGEDFAAEQGLQDATHVLRLGSFCLEGELWQICIRELLKIRLNRLSQVLKNSMCDGEDHEARHGELSHAEYNTGLMTALKSMTGDVYSKIEFLFGMMELWES